MAMVNWNALLADDEEERREKRSTGDDGKELWRQEAADSLCELYYETYRLQKRGAAARIDLRPGSDYQRFLETHMRPLGKHGVWEALFPNEMSAMSAQAIDEALHLLADTKLVDRIYADDLVTASKLILNIKKKRAKYLEM
jgi:hypothetical protein